MAWTFVRSVGTTVTGTGTAVALTVGASGAAINDIVVVGIAVTANVSPTSVTDTQGNTYAKVGGSATVSTTIDAEIWASKLGSALVSGNSITVNFAASRTCSIGALEFSGGTVSVDVSNIGATAATDVPPPASITTTVANDLVIAITANSASGTLDVNPSANYTAGVSKITSVPSMYFDYSIVAGTATRAQGTAQWTVSTGGVATSNVALKLTAGVAGAAPTISTRRRPNFARRGAGRSVLLSLTQQPTPPPPYVSNPTRQRSRTSWTSRRRQPVAPLTQTAVTVTFTPTTITRAQRRSIVAQRRTQPRVPAMAPVVVPAIRRPQRRIAWLHGRQIQSLPPRPATAVVVTLPPQIARPVRRHYTVRRGAVSQTTIAATAAVTVTYVPPIARPQRRGYWFRARQLRPTPLTQTATVVVANVPQIARPVRRGYWTRGRVQPGTPIVAVSLVPQIPRPMRKVRRALWTKPRRQPGLPNQSVAAVQAVFLPDIASSRRRTGFSRRGHLVTVTTVQTAAVAPNYVPQIARPQRMVRRALLAKDRPQPQTPIISVSLVPQISRPVRRVLLVRDRLQPTTPRSTVVIVISVPPIASVRVRRGASFARRGRIVLRTTGEYAGAPVVPPVVIPHLTRVQSELNMRAMRYRAGRRR